ncbi:hypothetical protein CI238_11175 [Colletotrichum incanum]|uniref:Uncharacterized protein n=1 Tax=Colletotrichum incanum TaxID=1573173 RepID=A0A167EFS4_COLIC|nr:hypothetical protein CI238_11175 [Colletotrichum incanum]
MTMDHRLEGRNWLGWMESVWLAGWLACLLGWREGCAAYGAGRAQVWCEGGSGSFTGNPPTGSYSPIIM